MITGEQVHLNLINTKIWFKHSLRPFQPHQSQRCSDFGPLCAVHFLLGLQYVLQCLEPCRVGVKNCFDFLSQREKKQQIEPFFNVIEKRGRRVTDLTHTHRDVTSYVGLYRCKNGRAEAVWGGIFAQGMTEKYKIKVGHNTCDLSDSTALCAGSVLRRSCCAHASQNRRHLKCQAESKGRYV